MLLRAPYLQRMEQIKYPEVRGRLKMHVPDQRFYHKLFKCNPNVVFQRKDANLTKIKAKQKGILYSSLFNLLPTKNKRFCSLSSNLCVERKCTL